MFLRLHVSLYLSNPHLGNQVSSSLNSRNKVASSLQSYIFQLNPLVSNKAQIPIQVSPLCYGLYKGSLLHGFSDCSKLPPFQTHLLPEASVLYVPTCLNTCQP